MDPNDVEALWSLVAPIRVSLNAPDPTAVKSVGKHHRHPYNVRLAAVRRYLEGNESAAQVAAGIGVSEPTIRRYVRELRWLVENDQPSEN